MTATVLEAAAGQLRKLSDADELEEETVAESGAPAATTQTTQAKPRTRPAPATRTRIANPKAAKKVRAREG